MPASNAHANAIMVAGLTKRFGDFTAVDGISFEVRRGEIFGFLGPNGSGKTTTIRMMLGLMTPTAGAAEVVGMRVDRDMRLIRPRVGYMSQRFSLYNDLTARQNLEFYGAAYGLGGLDRERRIGESLGMAGLQRREHVRTKDLSGGWRQRLALGAAILHRPEVLFLDEPTAGVDPLSRRTFWDLLYEFAAAGTTVFVTTHYMDEAERCHRLAFIQRGGLTALGSPAEIKAKMMRGQVLELEPSDAPGAVRVLRAARDDRKLPLEAVELYGALVHVVAPRILEHQKAIADSLSEAGIRTGQMSVIEPSLEDVFISCMTT
jgi:ABC-2 type transport system ATP-binding protein